VSGEGGEERVHPGDVSEALGIREGQLPVGPNGGEPFLVVAVFSAEQCRADRPEQVMPRRRPDLAVGAESAQHADPHEHGQSVPRRDHAAEPEGGELSCCQHPMFTDCPDQEPVTAGQVRRSSQHCLIRDRCCGYPCPVPPGRCGRV
jgi:hypothetical protein